MAKKNGWLTGDSLAGTTSRLLVIPGDLTMIMAVTGALEPLTHDYNWEKFGTIEPEDAAYAMRLMLLNYLSQTIPPPEPRMDSSMIIFPDELTINVGQPFAWVSDTLSSLGGYWQQSPALITDAFDTSRFFSSGVWAYRIVYFRIANGGASFFEISTNPGGVTLYSTTISWFGTTQRNSVFTGTFTIPANGKYNIIFAGILPNPSSTGNFRPTQRIEFHKTAELP